MTTQDGEDQMLTQARLKELLEYNPETGIFVRKISYARVYRGQEITAIDSKGYITAGIDRKRYRAHRLAFLYMTGSWPKNQVDHINHQKTDNRWANLRDVTGSQNQRNRCAHKNNKSGVMGVIKYRGRWVSQITVNGRNITLGSFEELSEAIICRKAAEKEHGFHKNHGENL